MQMNMIYGLAALGIAVGYDPETPFGNTLIASNLIRHFHHMPEKSQILISNVQKRCYMFLGDKKDMHGGLRAGIFESENGFVLEYDLRRYLFLSNPAKNTIFHRPSP